MTGTPWLDLETRWFFEDNIEELRKRPILNINKVKDAPPRLAVSDGRADYIPG